MATQTLRMGRDATADGEASTNTTRGVHWKKRRFLTSDNLVAAESASSRGVLLDCTNAMLSPMGSPPFSKAKKFRKRMDSACKAKIEYRGVSWDAASQAWQAQARLAEGVAVLIGTFPDAESAARAYDAAVIEHSGLSSVLNLASSVLKAQQLPCRGPETPRPSTPSLGSPDPEPSSSGSEWSNQRSAWAVQMSIAGSNAPQTVYLASLEQANRLVSLLCSPTAVDASASGCSAQAVVTTGPQATIATPTQLQLSPLPVQLHTSPAQKLDDLFEARNSGSTADATHPLMAPPLSAVSTSATKGRRTHRLPAGFLARQGHSPATPSWASRASAHHAVTWDEPMQQWAARVWDGSKAAVVSRHCCEDDAVASAARAAAGLSSSGSLPFSGLSWFSATRRWEASLATPGRLGVFQSASQAQAALTAAMAQHRSAPQGPSRPGATVVSPSSPSLPSAAPAGRPRSPASTSAGSPCLGGNQRGASCYRGVSSSEASAKWRAQVWDGSRVLYIGTFGTEEAAARAYDAAVIKIRGPAAAKTNFPLSDYAADPSDRSPSSSAGAPDQTPSKPSPVAPTASANSSKSREAVRSVRGPAANKGSSKYKGVSWSERSHKWRAQIWNSGKVRHLGFYHCEIEAARIFDRAAVETRGAKAIVNFADSLEAPEQGAKPLPASEDRQGAASTSGVRPAEPSPCSQPEVEHGGDDEATNADIRTPQKALRPSLDASEVTPVKGLQVCAVEQGSPGNTPLKLMRDDHAVAGLLLTLMGC